MKYVDPRCMERDGSCGHRSRTDCVATSVTHENEWRLPEWRRRAQHKANGRLVAVKELRPA